MKYKRLTEKKEDRGYLKDMFWACANEPTMEEIDNIYVRLAELEDKIENGTLFELSYTMGDKIFGVKQVFDDKGRIVWFLFEDTIRDISYHIQGAFNLQTIQINHIDSKYVFKTKEQAKAKLKELQGKES